MEEEKDSLDWNGEACVQEISRLDQKRCWKVGWEKSFDFYFVWLPIPWLKEIEILLRKNGKPGECEESQLKTIAII